MSYDHNNDKIIFITLMVIEKKVYKLHLKYMAGIGTGRPSYMASAALLPKSASSSGRGTTGM